MFALKKFNSFALYFFDIMFPLFTLPLLSAYFRAISMNNNNNDNNDDWKRYAKTEIDTMTCSMFNMSSFLLFE